jgi:hypothetical protein
MKTVGRLRILTYLLERRIWIWMALPRTDFVVKGWRKKKRRLKKAKWLTLVMRMVRDLTKKASHLSKAEVDSAVGGGVDLEEDAEDIEVVEEVIINSTSSISSTSNIMGKVKVKITEDLKVVAGVDAVAVTEVEVAEVVIVTNRTNTHSSSRITTIITKVKVEVEVDMAAVREEEGVEEVVIGEGITNMNDLRIALDRVCVSVSDMS